MSEDRSGGSSAERGLTIEEVRISGFRSIHSAAFSPGPLSALVGGPGTGKSNLLTAIRAALDPAAMPLTPDDLTREGPGPVRVEVRLADASVTTLSGTPPAVETVSPGDSLPMLYLPAAQRASSVVADTGQGSARQDELRAIIAESVASRSSGGLPTDRGATEPAHGLVSGIESCMRAGLSGVVLLIEEPELFLPPQTQRYLYRLLREFTANDNQVLYSTHSPSFLNVARLHELVLTRHTHREGTRLVQPTPLPADDEFRAYSEFDAARSEIFLARAAILVEGQTERLALPFVFRAMGHDPDRERISIVECGGKSNIELVASVCKTVGVPFLAVHDRDAAPGKKPIMAERVLNRRIGVIAGEANRIELAPDFEGVAGLRGHRHKPARAWRSFANLEAADTPEELAHIVHRALALARR